MAGRKRANANELPFRQLGSFWSWLPAFRAVAETGGVNEAARQLHLSPSALSRSVTCLESALGEPLFHREAGFVLTARGESLLAATRDAMRGVHAATEASAVLAGPLRVGATSRLGIHRMLPALRALRRAWPEAEPWVSSVREDEVEPLLLRGALDLAIVLGTRAPRSLEGTALAPASSHVYCGRGHALYPVKRPSDEAVLAHPFAAPIAPGGREVVVDGWPPDRARTIALWSDTLDPAIDACLSGELLVCLPDEIVVALALADRLRALPRPELPATPLLCLTRRAIGQRPTLAAELVTRLSSTERPSTTA